jgi:hypothetical protein
LSDRSRSNHLGEAAFSAEIQENTSMSKSSEAFTAAVFKRVPDGFIFRAPNPWMFGRARHYLVNEAQKAAIAARATGVGRRGLLLAFLIWLAAFAGIVVALALLTGHDDPTLGDSVILFVCAVASLLVCLHVWYLWVLRPFIAELPESRERITYRERREGVRRAMFLQSSLLTAAISSVACVANLFAFFLGTHGGRHLSFDDGQTFVSLFVAVVFALLAARCFYLEITGPKPSADENTEAGSQLVTDALALRLERVELDNRRLRRSLAAVVALGAVVALVAVVVSGLLTRVVEADDIILRNSKGESVAQLGVTKDGSPSLGFYGPEHKLRALFALTSTGSPVLGLYDSEQSQRITFALGNDEMPLIMLSDAQKKVRAQIALQRNGVPGLWLYDPQQGVRAALSLNADQDPSLTLFDAPAVVPRAVLGLDTNRTGALNLFSSSGGLNLNGSNGAVRWNPVTVTTQATPTQK